MSLTFQPFAQVPAILDLSKELHKNVGEGERLGSALAGLGMLMSVRRASGLGKLGLLISGSALLYRAMSGHCAVYHRLNKDTYHTDKKAEVKTGSSPDGERPA